ncbi:MAG: WD40 repeat domain-containing protein, partial [Planctomycetota bacterium]
DALRLRVLGHTLSPGVVLATKEWRHLAVSWSGLSGELAVVVDGRVAWAGTGPRAELPAGGSLGVGPLDGSVKRVAWFDRVLHPSRMLSHVLVAQGLRAPSTPRPRLPVTFRPQTVNIDSISAVAFSPDGRLLVSGGRSGISGAPLLLWDVEANAVIRSLHGHRTQIHAVAFSPDGRLVASGTTGRSLWLWDVETGRRIRSLEGHTEQIESLAFHPGGRLLASGGRTVRLWDVATGEQVRALSGHKRLVRSLAFTRDGSRLLSGADDLRLWDVATGELLQTFEEAQRFRAATLTPDGRHVFCAMADRSVRLLEVGTGRVVRSVSGAHRRSINTVAVGPRGDLALSAGDDGHVKVWDLRTGREIRALAGRTYRVTGWWTTPAVYTAIFDPTGRFVASGGAGRGIKLWSVATGRVERLLSGDSSRPHALAVHPGGHLVLSVREHHRPKLWDLSTLRVVRTFEGPPLPYRGSVTFTPDGRHAVYAGGDPVAETTHFRVWDVASGKLLRSESREKEACSTAGLSPDGRLALVASGHGGGRKTGLKLWDVETAKVVRPFVGLEAPAMAVAFSPDGRHALTAGGDSMAGHPTELKIWDAEAGKPVRSLHAAGPIDLLDRKRLIHRLEGHRGEIKCAVWSPDGRRIITGGVDATLKVWETSSGRLLRTLRGHTRGVKGLAVSRDGRLLLSGSFDRTVRLWDLDGGRELRRFEGHTEVVHSVAFSADGRLVVSAAGDQTLKIWQIDGERSLTLLSTPTEWLVYDDDGLFDSSPGAGSLVAMVQGTHGFRIDQLALLHNRPDRLLARFGLGTPELRGHYEARYRRRLKKAGLTPEDVTGRLDLPAARIVATRRTEDPVGVHLDFELRDHTGLRGYQIFVNDVPLFHGSGKPVTGRRVRRTETVRLTTGPSKIELTARNDRGQESLRAVTYVSVEGKGIRLIAGHAGTVAAVVFHPDGRRLLTGGDDGTLKLWDLASGEVLRTFRGHAESVR